MRYFQLRKCPVCLSEDYTFKWKLPAERYFYEKFGISHAKVVECCNCHIQYTNPILETNMENLQYTDPQSGYNIKECTTPAQTYWEDQLICLQEIKKLNLEHGKVNVLDFGCGRGGMVYLCQKNEISAVGIDINRHNISVGMSLGIKNLVVKELCDIEDDSFDVITAIHILEHLENCSMVVSEFRRILKRKSYVFVLVPNAKSLRCRVNFKRYWKAPYQHMNGFTMQSLDFLFTQFGFKRVHLKGRYTTLSMLLTKFCGNTFNFFPTKLFCGYTY